MRLKVVRMKRYRPPFQTQRVKSTLSWALSNVFFLVEWAAAVSAAVGNTSLQNRTRDVLAAKRGKGRELGCAGQRGCAFPCGAACVSSSRGPQGAQVELHSPVGPWRSAVLPGLLSPPHGPAGTDYPVLAARRALQAETQRYTLHTSLSTADATNLFLSGRKPGGAGRMNADHRTASLGSDGAMLFLQ